MVQPCWLAGYAKRSIESYACSVLRLQRFYNKPLEDITEEDLRQYWLCCEREFGWSAATLRISYSGIQHFFTRTLVRSWTIFSKIKWKREETPPTILSVGEVKKIIYALPTLQSRIFYLALYSMGLRLGDILSDRGLVHIHSGKGALDRMVPLPKITLLSLREYYRTHRNPRWIFPALGHNGGKGAMEFIRRFLQHVLPKGFMKIRHYGLLNPNSSLSIEKLRELILLVRETVSVVDPHVPTIKGDRLECPCCGGLLRYIAFLKPNPAWGPSG